MVTITHETDINASAARIWEILWNAETYPEWKDFFHKNSSYQSDWKIGGKTVFLEGENRGVLATIQSLNAPYEVVFQHIGLLQNGEEITETREVLEWKGNPEKYFLTELEDHTRLEGEIVVLQEYEDHIRKAYNDAFQKIKELAEAGS